MTPAIGILAAFVAVCVLIVGRGGPRVFASLPVVSDGDTDRDALAALYQAADGESWLRNDNWLDDCEWAGGSWRAVFDGRASENQESDYVDIS